MQKYNIISAREAARIWARENGISDENIISVLPQFPGGPNYRMSFVPQVITYRTDRLPTTAEEQRFNELEEQIGQLMIQVGAEAAVVVLSFTGVGVGIRATQLARYRATFDTGFKRLGAERAAELTKLGTIVGGGAGGANATRILAANNLEKLNILMEEYNQLFKKAYGLQTIIISDAGVPNLYAALPNSSIFVNDPLTSITLSESASFPDYASKYAGNIVASIQSQGASIGASQAAVIEKSLAERFLGADNTEYASIANQLYTQLGLEGGFSRQSGAIEAAVAKLGEVSPENGSLPLANTNGGDDKVFIPVTASVAADGTTTINIPPGLALDGGAGVDTLVLRITNPLPQTPSYSVATLPANVKNFEDVQLEYTLEPQQPEPNPTPTPNPDPSPPNPYGYSYSFGDGAMFNDGNGGYVFVAW